MNADLLYILNIHASKSKHFYNILDINFYLLKIGLAAIGTIGKFSSLLL